MPLLFKGVSLVVLTGVAVSGGVVAWPTLSGDADRTPAVASEQAAPIVRRTAITSLGRIEPSGRLVEVGAPSDACIAEILVAENDWVDAGQELFRLDSFAERVADREMAAASLAVARDRLTTEVELAERMIRNAESALRRIDELVPVEIDAQKARVQVIEIQLDNEKRRLRRERELGDIVSGKKLDTQQVAVAEAASRLAAAMAELRVRKARHKHDQLDARAELQRMRTMLQRARIVYSPAAAEKELARAEARLEAARVRAPRAGRVLAVLRDPGERAGFDAVMQIGNTREMHCVAEVYETDVAAVYVSQPATIESPAFGGRLVGEVVRVGTMVAKNDVLDVDPLADTDTRVVEVLIRLHDGKVVRDLTNLEVDVAIELRKQPGGAK